MVAVARKKVSRNHSEKEKKKGGGDPYTSTISFKTEDLPVGADVCDLVSVRIVL